LACRVWFPFFAELTAEQLEYQQLARKFGREVIKPAAAKYDQSGEVGLGCKNGCHRNGGKMGTYWRGE